MAILGQESSKSRARSCHPLQRPSVPGKEFKVRDQRVLTHSLKALARFFSTASPIAFGMLLLLLLVVRLRTMGAAATVPIARAILRHDAPIAGAILLLYSLSLLVHRSSPTDHEATRWRRLTSLSLRVLAVLVAATYCLDIFVYRFFTTRLYVTDVVLFRHDWKVGLGLLSTLLQRPAFKLAAIVALAALGFWIFWLFLSRPAKPPKWVAIALGIAGILLPFARFIPQMEFFINKPLFENFLERNWEFLTPKEYSPSFRQRLRQTYSEPPQCEPGLGGHPNFLLLVVESLSAYQSRYFSGIHDYTPNLDRMAEEHTALTNFYANGWTSQGGAIALLTEALPIVPEHADLNEWGSARINQFYSPAALPKYLHGEGYKSYYFAAGSVTFLNQNEWLERIGFDEVSGDEDPEYAGQPRGVLNSVTDDVLYDRVLKTMASLPPEQRFFMMLATYRSHRPLKAPDGSRISEEAAFHEVDVQLAAFQRKLRDIGYFKNGVLMITGDHRAMEPFTEPELRRFGMSASARLPFVVVADSLKLPNVIAGNFQQHDLFPSIRAVVSSSYCHDRWEGTFLTPMPHPPTCILHAKGESRDLVYVRCGQQEGIVFLDGDRTHLASGDIADRKFVIDKINFERILRGETSSSPQ
jgi:lipoteichoic acid synthase